MRFKIALGLALTCFAFAQEPEILKRVLPGLSNTFSTQLNTELEAEIISMVKEDQTARDKIADFTDLSEEEKTTLSEIKARHNFRLKEIISTYGWPGIRLVGLDGSAGIWLLIQHQDQDLEFQKQCLALLKEAVGKQDAQLREYAFLFDRVRKNENLPQVYGTQFDFREGKCYIYPIEDLKNLEQRRLEAGLGSFESYQKFMKQIYRLSDEDFIIEDILGT